MIGPGPFDNAPRGATLTAGLYQISLNPSNHTVSSNFLFCYFHDFTKSISSLISGRSEILLLLSFTWLCCTLQVGDFWDTGKAISQRELRPLGYLFLLIHATLP